MFEQTFKNIDDVLWKEAGCTTELDYTEQTSWMLFLRYLDDLEHERATEAELRGRSYEAAKVACSCTNSNLFKDEDQLRELWGRPDTRKALLESLAERGFGEAQLREMGRMIDAENSDVYDVLAYVAYAAAPITREKRVATRRDDIVAPYDETLQAFLDFVLVQYVDEGVGELDDAKLPDLLELKYHSLHDAAAKLGGAANIRQAFVGFQAGLYRLP